MLKVFFIFLQSISYTSIFHTWFATMRINGKKMSWIAHTASKIKIFGGEKGVIQYWKRLDQFWQVSSQNNFKKKCLVQEHLNRANAHTWRSGGIYCGVLHFRCHTMNLYLAPWSFQKLVMPPHSRSYIGKSTAQKGSKSWAEFWGTQKPPHSKGLLQKNC